MSARDDYPALTTLADGVAGPTVSRECETALNEIDHLRADNSAWMNGVADAVEHLGFDREAACGPADLLPGLKWLVERTDDCAEDCEHAPMCRKWEA